MCPPPSGQGGTRFSRAPSHMCLKERTWFWSPNAPDGVSLCCLSALGPLRGLRPEQRLGRAHRPQAPTTCEAKSQTVPLVSPTGLGGRGCSHCYCTDVDVEAQRLRDLSTVTQLVKGRGRMGSWLSDSTAEQKAARPSAPCP